MAYTAYAAASAAATGTARRAMTTKASEFGGEKGAAEKMGATSRWVPFVVVDALFRRVAFFFASPFF